MYREKRAGAKRSTTSSPLLRKYQPSMTGWCVANAYCSRLNTCAGLADVSNTKPGRKNRLEAMTLLASLSLPPCHRLKCGQCVLRTRLRRRPASDQHTARCTAFQIVARARAWRRDGEARSIGIRDLAPAALTFADAAISIAEALPESRVDARPIGVALTVFRSRAGRGRRGRVTPQTGTRCLGRTPLRNERAALRGKRPEDSPTRTASASSAPSSTI